MMSSNIGMREEHIQLLRRLRADIVRVLHVDKILDIMVADEIFDIEDVQNIKCKSTMVDKARELIDQLIRKGPNAFESFVKACLIHHPNIAQNLIKESGIQLPTVAHDNRQTHHDVTLRVLDYCSKNLTLPDCKILARDLGVSHVDMDTIYHDNPADTETQKYLMLKKWHTRCGSSATLDILYHKLENNGQKAVAEGCQVYMSQNAEVQMEVQVEEPMNSHQCLLRDTNFMQCIANVPDLSMEHFNVIVNHLQCTPEQTELLEQNLSLQHFLQSWCPHSLSQWCHLVEVLEREKYGVNRRDVSDLLQRYLPPGIRTAGPKLERSTRIKDIGYDLWQKLVLELSVQKENGRDWRLVASKLGIPQNLISLWKQNEKTPMENVLQTWAPDTNATVGFLYDLLVDNGMSDEASILETD